MSEFERDVTNLLARNEYDDAGNLCIACADACQCPSLHARRSIISLKGSFILDCKQHGEHTFIRNADVKKLMDDRKKANRYGWNIGKGIIVTTGKISNAKKEYLLKKNCYAIISNYPSSNWESTLLQALQEEVKMQIPNSYKEEGEDRIIACVIL